MSTNSFVRHADCGHSNRIDHSLDLERSRPLCIDCYHAEEDEIYERYYTTVDEASERDLAAMTVAFEAEAEKPVDGSWIEKIQNIMITSNTAVSKNVAAVERERDKEVEKLWKESGYGIPG